MFARTALRSAHPITQQRRGYASEPINLERGPSRTPFFIAAAVVVLAGGYFSGIFNTPPTPAVKNMQKAMHPKTDQAKEAAGIAKDPLDEPLQVGGGQKGRQ